jgi:NDP-sugar pyrophosphorylase family protein
MTMPAIEQAAILCGGLGTRLGALTAATPKPLLPVGERPFLDILLGELGQAGVTRILLLAGFMAERIADYAAATPVTKRFGLAVDVAAEPYPAGTGGALWHARDRLDERFFLLNGDSWFDIPLGDLGERLAAEESAIGVVALREVADASRYGAVTLAGDRVTDFAERPAQPGPGLISGASMRFAGSCSTICARAARWSATRFQCSPRQVLCAASPSTATSSISGSPRIWRAPGTSLPT